MKRYITKTLFVFGFILTAISLNACSSNTTNKAAVKAENGDDHDDDHHGESSIVALSQAQMNAVGIKLGDLETKNLTANITVNGVLRVPNQNKADITSLYGGVIKSLRVELGQRVSKGQVVATIENPQFVQFQEEYITTASRIMQAEQELSRQQELNEGNAGAKRNLQNATAELATLRTRRASLRQQIQMMGINPDRVSDANLQNLLQVTSPVNGVISQVYAKVGSYVDVSSAIAEVLDNSQLHLDLQVFEKDLPKIKIGQVINFVLTNNPTTSYQAKVFNVGSSFQNESKTIAVHSTIQGNKTGLIDGMNVTAALSIADVATLAVPNSAIVESEGRSYLFVQTDDEESAVHVHTDGDNHEDKQKSEEEPHVHVAGEAHDHEKENTKQKTDTVHFERIEIVKGVSYLGYTGITSVKSLPKNAKIVVSGGFFINAKLNDTGEAGHAH
ncbi:efflux RND transporter periplasmic adaptor subunit [Sphingobacterium sp. lm-10]|uniref:efflux RND transporter periplasmic adaptor subunit n=1 Tax=Sphingobacterium sp. lm-10 TaxID=2944904 RepID=UPI002020E3D0|nr:efflux RND transporter periplasmic adaptor subunit [Sphingobacterium sp. lm-10]MCL7986473.1 efflux RND transporter periplasmic adaptor subunit [Sphingobacterium sp. lm-10]